MSEPTLPTRGRDIAALIFAMTFPSFLAWVSFIALAARGQDGEINRALQIFFPAAKFVQFSFPLLYLALFEPTQLRPTRPHLRGLGVAVSFGLMVALAIFGLYFLGLKGTSLFASTAAKIDRWLRQVGLPSETAFLFVAGFIAVVHSMWEEFYWRGFIFARLTRFLHWFTAAIIAGLAFMSHHVIVLYFYLPGYLWVVALFSFGVAIGGFIWAWIYHRSQSLYATWLSHCIIDLAIMVVAYDLLFSSRPNG